MSLQNVEELGRVFPESGNWLGIGAHTDGDERAVPDSIYRIGKQTQADRQAMGLNGTVLHGIQKMSPLAETISILPDASSHP